MKQKNIIIEPYNYNGQRHGYWERSYQFGKIGLKRYYINDKVIFHELKLSCNIQLEFNL